jgi:hypothetical protein
MYTSHPGLPCEISDEVVIWRYLDFTKYVDLLTWQSLWFARLNTLGDPFEGTYPAENHARFAHMAMQEMEGLKDASKEERDQRFNIVKGTAGWASRFNGACAYVSCWHNNDYESAAMWKLYLKSDEGIAIRSTTRRLVDCLAKCPEKIFVSKVKYIDFSKEAVENDRRVWNNLDGIIHKRVSFSHENEVRAFMHKAELLDLAEGETTVNLERPTLPGYSIGIDLNRLVESVYVSPTATDWFYKLVKTISSRFQMTAPINWSVLGEKPIL